ncbi:MAG: hypothetical protein RB191_24625, partial [Terriglobia bacterium]|nr:hypothetical protein [Terriglobia bacterium]
MAASAKVDTSAPLGLTGDWLLDPDTINIVGSACGSTTSLPSNGTLTTATDAGQTDAILNSTIITALSSTDVTLEASNAINVDANITWSTSHSLNLLSEGNINVNAGIQNSGTGAINVIAGWDGSTLSFSPNMSGSVYGQSCGSVNITSGGSSIAVGSLSGQTIVAGYDVNVHGSSGDAQIGFAGSGGGNISVLAKNDVVVVGGNGFAQIGNGGYEQSGAATGNITVVAADDISLTGGTGSNYAQIGNGGVNGTASTAGNISVFAGKDVNLTGGSGAYADAQIGNGGDSSTGVNSGNIVVNATGDISLTGEGDYAQIGDGGWGAASSSGNITVNAGKDLTLDDASGAYGVWIGNGGQYAYGTD